MYLNINFCDGDCSVEGSHVELIKNFTPSILQHQYIPYDERIYCESSKYFISSCSSPIALNMPFNAAHGSYGFALGTNGFHVPSAGDISQIGYDAVRHLYAGVALGTNGVPVPSVGVSDISQNFGEAVINYLKPWWLERGPIAGMGFAGFDDLMHFYKAHAKFKGFNVIKRGAHRVGGKIKYVSLSCDRGGRSVGKRITSKKIMCPAKVCVKLEANGMWRVTKVVTDHVHEIIPRRPFSSLLKPITRGEHLSGDGETDQPRPSDEGERGRGMLRTPKLLPLFPGA